MIFYYKILYCNSMSEGHFISLKALKEFLNKISENLAKSML